MLIKRLLAAGAIALMGMASASADEMMDDHSGAWTGPYIGFTTGYSHGTANYYFNSDGWYNTQAGQTFSHGISGMPIGGFWGFNWQAPNSSLVVGFEGSVQSSFTWLGAWDVVNPFFPDTDTFDHKVHYWATFGPRIGHASGPLLFYGEAGITVAHVISHAESTAGQDVYNDVSSYVTGPYIGLGLDIALGDNVLLGLGYRYHALGPNNVNGEALFVSDNTPAGVYTDHQIRTGFSSFLVRIGMRF